MDFLSLSILMFTVELIKLSISQGHYEDELTFVSNISAQGQTYERLDLGNKFSSSDPRG